MQLNFSDIEKPEKLVVFSDGKDVVDYFDSVLKAIDEIGFNFYEG